MTDYYATELIPLPNEKKYLEMGPVRQKMGRILLYVIQKYSAATGLERDYPNYAASHAIIYAAWERLNADTEFCEQVELYLPTPVVSPDPVEPSPGDPLDCWLGGPETYLTKEMLQKAVESYKLASVAPGKSAKEYAKYEDFLNYEI